MQAKPGQEKVPDPVSTRVASPVPQETIRTEMATSSENCSIPASMHRVRVKAGAAALIICMKETCESQKMLVMQSMSHVMLLSTNAATFIDSKTGN